MTKESLGLHSHSALERDLSMSKRKVLVDFKFAPMFSVDALGDVFVRNGVKYIEVDTRAFVQKNGIFKNFSK